MICKGGRVRETVVSCGLSGKMTVLDVVVVDEEDEFAKEEEKAAAFSGGDFRTLRPITAMCSVERRVAFDEKKVSGLDGEHTKGRRSETEDIGLRVRSGNENHRKRARSHKEYAAEKSHETGQLRERYRRRDWFRRSLALRER